MRLGKVVVSPEAFRHAQKEYHIAMAELHNQFTAFETIVTPDRLIFIGICKQFRDIDESEGKFPSYDVKIEPSVVAPNGIQLTFTEAVPQLKPQPRPDQGPSQIPQKGKPN